MLNCGCKYRQVLGHSSSSQISGTCDSQACFCCGDLKLGVKCISSSDATVGFSPYSNALF